MPVLFAILPRKRSIRKGYLFCPRCYQRTSGEMFHIESVFYLLGFIPVGSTGESQNLLTCHRCAESFEESGDWAFDFGDHAEPQLWECRKCGEQNTSERFNCRRCGRHV